MSLLPKGTRLVVATHNPGKLTEINDLLRPLGFDAVSAASLGLAEPDETGDSFAANAILKAQASAMASGLPALSDDSGLCVDGLDGAPGIYSARWAGPSKDFSQAMQLVESELQKIGTSNRRAHFICALCLAFPDGTTMSHRARAFQLFLDALT